MGKLLNNTNLSPQEALELGKRVAERWNDLGFLDGVSEPLRGNVAKLLESEATQLLKEETLEEKIDRYSQSINLPISYESKVVYLFKMISMIKEKIYKYHC